MATSRSACNANCQLRFSEPEAPAAPSRAIRYSVPFRTSKVAAAPWPEPSATFSRLSREDPVYTPRSGLKPLPAPSMDALPDSDGVQLHHTDLPPCPPACAGSPGSFVAFRLLPPRLPEASGSTMRSAKLSLAGAPSAASMFRRGVVTPLRASETGVPVAVMRATVCSRVSEGCAKRSSAAAAATWGAACEVPAICMPAAVMKAPGASMVRKEALLEKQGIMSGAEADESLQTEGGPPQA